ncbi:MAG TPA: hypothetical protein VF163_05890 [Micromonosporaceae bacterium]
MPAHFSDAAPRAWDDIPGVALVGIVIGLVPLVAAIRAMFGRRDR